MIGRVRGAQRGEIVDLGAGDFASWLGEPRRLEVEVGFGKGRYLLDQARLHPETLFLGIEIVSQYFRLVARRAARHGLDNVQVLNADALYVLQVLLPRRTIDVLHVYFPDPWPKARHQRRRLFDFESLDVLLEALKADGRLLFATDHMHYGEVVERILRSHPLLDVRSLDAWPEGPRTHYEAKYVEEGRPIRRFDVRLRPAAAEFVAGDVASIHPLGQRGLLSAWSPPVELPQGELPPSVLG